MIPDEAVQAARLKLEDVLGGWFDDMDAIRQILEAAAPIILSHEADRARLSGRSSRSVGPTMRMP